MTFLFSPLLADSINSEQIVPGIGKAPITELTTGATTATVAIVGWLIAVFWVVAIGFIIWSAFLYLTAAGSEEHLTKAKAYLRYAIIAAAIALLSTGIQVITTNLLAPPSSSSAPPILTRCSLDSDCPSGYYCAGGSCLANPSQSCPGGHDYECNFGQHCGTDKICH